MRRRFGPKSHSRKPYLQRLFGEPVLGFFFDQQIDQCQALWFVGRFREQSAVPTEVESGARIIHGLSSINPEECSATASGAQANSARDTRGFALNAVDNEGGTTFSLPNLRPLRRRYSSLEAEPLADFVAHLCAERFLSGRPLLLIDIPSVEDVEII